MSVSDKVTKWAVLLNDSLNAHNMCVLWQQWKLIYFDLFPFTSNPTLIIVWWNENTICKFSTICDHQDSDDQKRRTWKWLLNKLYLFRFKMFVNSYLKTGGNFFHLLAQKVDKSIYGEMAAPIFCIFCICYQKDD